MQHLPSCLEGGMGDRGASLLHICHLPRHQPASSLNPPQLRSTRPGVYGSVLSVLSKDIILLIRLAEPALELCRLTNLGSRNASLETICILSLPELTTSASLRWATCFGEHPGHALFSRNRNSSHHPPHPDCAPSSSLLSSASGSSSRQLEGRGARRHLRCVPADGIISVVMHVHAMSGYFRTIDLSVRCRTLLGFSDAACARMRSPTPTPVSSFSYSGMGDVGVADDVFTVPWEEWGPKNTRVLEHDSLTWGSLVGERRATVGQVRPTCVTLRDYNPFRVRRALARTGGVAGREVKLPWGGVMKVITETSVYRGGEWFCEDIETSMPYVETVTPYHGCEGIFMDEDNVLAEVRTEVSKSDTINLCCND